MSTIWWSALELFKRGAPDVILLDWQLPTVSALDFLAQIKPLLNAENPPRIIYCTTEHDPLVTSKAINAGATDILIKPFTRKMMLAKLQPRALAA
jgi:two-component system, chemotaxis family, chemotaxis protein CheY